MVLQDEKPRRKTVTLGRVDSLTRKQAEAKLEEFIAIDRPVACDIDRVITSRRAVAIKPSVPVHRAGHTPYTSGAVSELLVAADLMARGFDVFRALNSNASCDLLYIDGGKVIRVEVKSQSLDSLLRALKQIGNYDVLACVMRSGAIRYLTAADVTPQSLHGLAGEASSADAAST